MGVIKGQNLRVMVGGYCIASATSCTFHIASNTEDSSTKDTVSGFQEIEVTGFSWDAQTESLVVTADPANASGKIPTDLLTTMLASTLVTLKFTSTTAGSNYNRTATTTLAYTGSAYITDISITAANRQNSTLSVTFTGTGALTKVS